MFCSSWYCQSEEDPMQSSDQSSDSEQAVTDEQQEDPKHGLHFFTKQKQ